MVQKVGKSTPVGTGVVEKIVAAAAATAASAAPLVILARLQYPYFSG